jgi:hypothetical protein
LPTPELSSLSRSVPQSGSIPMSKYSKCVICKKTLLRGPMGSIYCKSCRIKIRDDQALQARLAEVESEKLRSQKCQVYKISKPLFRKNFRARVRTEMIHRSPNIVHGHITPETSLDSCGSSESAKKNQVALLPRKRKHGKALMTVGMMNNTLIRVK